MIPRSLIALALLSLAGGCAPASVPRVDPARVALTYCEGLGEDYDAGYGAPGLIQSPELAELFPGELFYRVPLGTKPTSYQVIAVSPRGAVRELKIATWEGWDEAELKAFLPAARSAAEALEVGRACAVLLMAASDLDLGPLQEEGWEAQAKDSGREVTGRFGRQWISGAPCSLRLAFDREGRVQGLWTDLGTHHGR